MVSVPVTCQNDHCTLCSANGPGLCCQAGGGGAGGGGGGGAGGGWPGWSMLGCIRAPPGYGCLGDRPEYKHGWGVYNYRAGYPNGMVPNTVRGAPKEDAVLKSAL